MNQYYAVIFFFFSKFLLIVLSDFFSLCYISALEMGILPLPNSLIPWEDK